MYRKISQSWIKHWDFEVLDIICIEIAFFLAYGIRHYSAGLVAQSMYRKIGVLLVILDIVVTFFTRNYKGIIQRNAWQEFVSVCKHMLTIQLLLLVYEYVIKEALQLSRTVYILSFILSVLFGFAIRQLRKQIVRKQLSSEKNQNNLMILTTKEHIDKCIKDIYGKEYREFKISCIALPKEKNISNDDVNVPVIVGQHEILEYIRNAIVDEVYIDTFTDAEMLKYWITTFLSMGVTVHIGMGFLPENLPEKFIESFGKSQVITTSVKSVSIWQLAIKRMMDILGGIVGLFLMGIAFIFVAPVIKKNSPGPVFFKQQRVGKNGRTFYMYKFRSMYMDAEERKKELLDQNEMQGLMFKMKNDPRIIGSEKGPGKGIGNFIRKTSIDELPQFWNVLIGDMSLVGTRPPTVNEFKEYDIHHKIRLCMKPGLTGLWQVSGRNDISDFDEVVELDSKYITTWSIGEDIRIIFKTVAVVIRGEGSR